MERINVSEFKATCLRLLEKVRQTGEPIEILKNGEPLVVVYPPQSKSRKKAFGSLAHTLDGEPGDLIEPINDLTWEVLK